MNNQVGLTEEVQFAFLDRSMTFSGKSKEIDAVIFSPLGVRGRMAQQGRKVSKLVLTCVEFWVCYLKESVLYSSAHMSLHSAFKVLVDVLELGAWVYHEGEFVHESNKQENKRRTHV